ncbi:hypothetical protein L6R50_17390 [Myxococcota bacterium]|nr:hypothetical protein [Myxococcota bacterium]
MDWAEVMSESERGEPPSGRRRALLIEADPRRARRGARALESMGFQVDRADSVPAALRTAALARYALAVLPGSPGTTADALTRALRARGSAATVLVLGERRDPSAPSRSHAADPAAGAEASPAVPPPIESRRAHDAPEGEDLAGRLDPTFPTRLGALAARVGARIPLEWEVALEARALSRSEGRDEDLLERALKRWPRIAARLPGVAARVAGVEPAEVPDPGKAIRLLDGDSLARLVAGMALAESEPGPDAPWRPLAQGEVVRARAAALLAGWLAEDEGETSPTDAFLLALFTSLARVLLVRALQVGSERDPLFARMRRGQASEFLDVHGPAVAVRLIPRLTDAPGALQVAALAGVSRGASLHGAARAAGRALAATSARTADRDGRPTPEGRPLFASLDLGDDALDGLSARVAAAWAAIRSDRWTWPLAAPPAGEAPAPAATDDRRSQAA